ncbi:ligand-gated cation channel ZACN-like isoform 2-T2 [Pholidichthys leucotaenia]
MLQDTKNLRLISQLKLRLEWVDPDLKWDRSVYPYEEVVVPVSSIWTPDLLITNAISTSMKHSSRDLVVNFDGTVVHNVTINANVNCEINLFNYPFAADSCPVAIQSWSLYGCGTVLDFDEIKMVDSSHGDWETTDVTLLRQRDDRYYIQVSLRIKHSSPFITLLLPSFLILIADLVSSALPLSGGERNCFKVTLVLSFTMFLNLLNDKLPGDSQCSPIIRQHFCVILVLLVFSMLVSMVLTRISQEGSLILCCWHKDPDTKDREIKEEKDNEEANGDISMIPLEESENTQILRKVVKFLEALDAKEARVEQNQSTANKLDKAFFWFYSFIGLGYFVAMYIVMAKYECVVNHFDFWY